MQEMSEGAASIALLASAYEVVFQTLAYGTFCISDFARCLEFLRTSLC